MVPAAKAAEHMPAGSGSGVVRVRYNNRLYNKPASCTVLL